MTASPLRPVLPSSRPAFAFPAAPGLGTFSLADRESILDSGASAHITGDRSLFRGFVRTCCVPVVGVGGSTFAVGLGSGILRVGGLDVPLTRMFFVPGMQTTLVSVSELVEGGCQVVARKVNGLHAMELVVPSGSRCVLPVSGGLYSTKGGGLRGGQYFESDLDSCDVRGCVAVCGAVGASIRGNSHVGSIPLDELLHRRLGHVSWQSSRLAGRLRAVFGPKLGLEHRSSSCEACVLAKMKQTFSRAPPTRPATRPLERVHIDFVPAVPTLGPGGVTGFLLIVDEFTGMYFVHLIHHKSELPDIMQKFKLASERHFRLKLGQLLWPVELGCVRSDGEAVMVSNVMQAWCNAGGVRWELSSPYAQWQNGKAERAVQTLWQGAEAMRKAAGAPPYMWAYTVQAFAHVHNRLATGKSEASPWELWHGVTVPLTARLAHLRSWGCKAYAYVPRSQRRRLDDRARVCVFIGYSEASKAYILLDLATSAVVVSASVVFDETRQPLLVARERGVLVVPEPVPIEWQPASLLYPLADPLVAAVEPSPALPDVPLSGVAPPSADDAVHDLSLVEEPHAGLPLLSGLPADVPDLSPAALPPPELSVSPADLPAAPLPVAQAPAPAAGRMLTRHYMKRKAQESVDALFGPTLGAFHVRHGPDVKPPGPLVEARLHIAKRLVGIEPLSVHDFSRLKSAEVTLNTHAVWLRAFQASAVASTTASLLAVQAPATSSEALSGVNGPAWSRAMEEEMESMDDFGVWELVPPVPGAPPPLKCKWVYKIKRDKDGLVDRLKARLTLCGYRQREGRDFDKTWAPTARMRTVRWMLAEAASNGMTTAAMDCTSAFLHAYMDKDVHMMQPPGTAKPGQEHLVCRLVKALYGSKQASRLFYQLLVSTILAFAAMPGVVVTRSLSDDCLFTVRRGAELLRCVSHVDDLAVTHNSASLYADFYAHLRVSLRISDYDGAALSLFTGIAVSHKPDGGMGLSQSAYIRELLSRLGLERVPPAMSPELTGSKAKLRPLTEPLTPAEAAFMSDVPYRQSVAALWYIARGTRPDIFRAVQEVANHVANPGPVHWRAVVRIFRYLKRTVDSELILKGPGVRGFVTPVGADDQLVGFSDADWAGCVDTSVSKTGWLVWYRGSLISWRSSAQSSISQSSCEAEYVASASLANEVVWWRQFLSEVSVSPVGPTVLFCDNLAAVGLAEHAGSFEATKHFRLRYHVLRKYQAEGDVRVVWCPSSEQLADILTKNVSVKSFRRIATVMLGVVV